MESTRNTPAIILNRQAYREYDSLVTVYTRFFGKLNLIARGTKRLQSKLAGHIEPLALADLLIISGKGRDYIGSAITRQAWPRIREDLNKIYYAGRILKLFSRLVKENQADERLFFLLLEGLAILDSRSDSLAADKGELFSIFFAWQLAAALGYQPEMRCCLSCRQSIMPGKNYFNFKNGGLLCVACLDSCRNSPEFLEREFVIISDDSVKLVRFALDNNLAKFDKLKIEKKLAKESSILIKNFLDFHF